MFVWLYYLSMYIISCIFYFSFQMYLSIFIVISYSVNQFFSWKLMLPYAWRVESKMQTTHKLIKRQAERYLMIPGPPNSPPTNYIVYKIRNVLINCTYDSSEDQNNETQNSYDKENEY